MFDHYDTMKAMPHRDNHGCFGCGSTNDCGLGMEFRVEDGVIFSRVTVPERHRGWQHLTHGGIIATILDEVMSWAAIANLKQIILTKSMNVQYLRPLPVGSTVLASGRVREIRSDREAVMSAEIHDAEGKVLASATGLFAVFSIESARSKKLMDEASLAEMEAMLALY